MSSRRRKAAADTDTDCIGAAHAGRRIEARLLGGFEVRIDGVLIADTQWRLRHPRLLCQMLLMSPDGLSREHVLSMLWPDTDPAAASNRLHHTLHLLRGVFASAGVPRSQPVAVLEADAIRPSPVHLFQVDAVEFLGCLSRTRASDDVAAEPALREALTLYRGEFAHGRPADEWVAQQREALRLEFAWALDRLAALTRASDRPQEAMTLYQQVVDLDPGNELAHRCLMELYAANGQAERAIHQYSVCKRLLKTELDVEPSPATQAVFQRILAQPQPAWLGRAVGAQAPSRRWQVHPTPCAVPLLGREDQVQQLLQRLADPAVRLVTITGAAGVGKSRVAHAVVERGQARFAQGALVVSCTGLTDARQVASAIARALGIALPTDGSAGAMLLAQLKPCELLLLIDRFEHVRAAAPQLGVLLQAAPGLKVMVTSQMPLRIDGEQVLEVAPLLGHGAAAAIDLFCSTAANAGVQIEGETARAQVARICERLEGNPLAIELAAGQTPVLSLQKILESLDRPLAMLTNPAVDAEPPQRSLRDAIAWTCDLLDGDAQALLAAMSVFGGRCRSDEPLQAFESLWAAATLRRCVQALCDAHLLRRCDTSPAAPSDGLEMPHPILQMAQERLAASPRCAAVEAAHAAHAARQVQAQFRRMRDEGAADTVDVALYHRASWHRGVSWMARRAPAREHLLMAYQFGVLAMMCGAVGDAMHVLTAAAERKDTVAADDQRLAAWCAYRLARACAWQGDSRLATRAIRAARRMAHATHEDQLYDRCLLQLASERIDQRRFRAARLMIESLLNKHEEQGSRRELLRDQGKMAALHGALGELSQATRAAERALQAAMQAGSEHHLAYAATVLCEASMRSGDMARAQRLIGQCHALPEHDFTPLRRLHFRLLECIADFESADFDSAQTKVDRLLESLRVNAWPPTRAVGSALAEMLAVELGKDEPAPILDDDFSVLPAGLHYDELSLRLQGYRMRRALAQGRARRAWLALQAATKWLARRSHPLWWAWTLEACALAAAHRGDAATCSAAVALSRQALRRADCQPTPRQQRNWARAEASIRDLPPLNAGPHRGLPMNWPRSDRLLIARLLTSMERVLMASARTGVPSGG